MTGLEYHSAHTQERATMSGASICVDSAQKDMCFIEVVEPIRYLHNGKQNKTAIGPSRPFRNRRRLNGTEILETKCQRIHELRFKVWPPTHGKVARSDEPEPALSQNQRWQGKYWYRLRFRRQILGPVLLGMMSLSRRLLVGKNSECD